MKKEKKVMILVAPLNLRVIDKGLRVCDGVDSLHTPRSSWDIFFPSSTTIDDMHPGGAPKLSLDHKLVCMVRTWNLPIETTQSWSGVKVHTICKVCTFHFLSLCPPLIHHLFSTIKKKNPLLMNWHSPQLDTHLIVAHCWLEHPK